MQLKLFLHLSVRCNRAIMTKIGHTAKVATDMLIYTMLSHKNLLLWSESKKACCDEGVDAYVRGLCARTCVCLQRLSSSGSMQEVWAGDSTCSRPYDIYNTCMFFVCVAPIPPPTPVPRPSFLPEEGGSVLCPCWSFLRRKCDYRAVCSGWRSCADSSLHSFVCFPSASALKAASICLSKTSSKAASQNVQFLSFCQKFCPIIENDLRHFSSAVLFASRSSPCLCRRQGLRRRKHAQFNV